MLPIVAKRGWNHFVPQVRRLLELLLEQLRLFVLEWRLASLESRSQIDISWDDSSIQ